MRKNYEIRGFNHIVFPTNILIAAISRKTRLLSLGMGIIAVITASCSSLNIESLVETKAASTVSPTRTRETVNTNTPEPTQTSTPEPPSAQEILEAQVDYLTHWGEGILGECPVATPEKLSAVDVSKYIVDSHGKVKEVGADYTLQDGEKTLKAQIIENFNNSGQTNSSGKKLVFEEPFAEVYVFQIEGKDQKGNKAQMPVVLISQFETGNSL